MASIDSVLNTLIPVTIFIVFGYILIRPFRKILGELKEKFGGAFGFIRGDEEGGTSVKGLDFE